MLKTGPPPVREAQYPETATGGLEERRTNHRGGRRHCDVQRRGNHGGDKDKKVVVGYHKPEQRCNGAEREDRGRRLLRLSEE